MSTSLLYYGFGLQGYRYQAAEFKAGAIHLKVQPKARHLRCPVCRAWDLIRKGCVTRSIRTVPIGRKAVWLHLEVPRVFCRKCGLVRQVRLPHIAQGRSYCRAFERLALDLCRVMTIRDVARFLRVSWDTIKGMLKRDLARRYAAPRLGKLRRIAIDEFYTGKRHRFLTIVLDLESGAVVFVAQGRGADALKPFWQRLRRSGARIEAVATDMGAAYVGAVLAHAPAATLVIDHFHVVKLLNEKLTVLRRQLYRELADTQQRRVLKGTRWILLKNPENLDPARDEHARLQEALRLNEPLAMAYYLKDDLRQIWLQPDKATAAGVLEDWVTRAMATGVAILHKFAKTLAAYRSGILAWYDHRISTGPLEGTNNKLRRMTRMAYGLRDFEFLKLRILALHETGYGIS